jgi:hypothetical protein
LWQVASRCHDSRNRHTQYSWKPGRNVAVDGRNENGQTASFFTVRIDHLGIIIDETTFKFKQQIQLFRIVADIRTSPGPAHPIASLSSCWALAHCFHNLHIYTYPLSSLLTKYYIIPPHKSNPTFLATIYPPTATRVCMALEPPLEEEESH